MKVAEFRKDLSTCLDRAVQGETIIIERQGQTFYLQLGPITHVSKVSNGLYVTNGVDPIKRYDATTEQSYVATSRSDVFVDKVNPKPKGEVEIPPIKWPPKSMFDRDIKFCKHDAVLGMCKKNCK